MTPNEAQKALIDNQALVLWMLKRMWRNVTFPDPALSKDDVVAECMAAVYESLLKYDPSVASHGLSTQIANMTRWTFIRVLRKQPDAATAEALATSSRRRMRAEGMYDFEFFASRFFPVPDADSEAAEAREFVAAAMRRLSPREQLVVRMRYWDKAKLDDIARVIGVTKERVRQILGECMEKMRLVGEPRRMEAMV